MEYPFTLPRESLCASFIVNRSKLASISLPAISLAGPNDIVLSVERDEHQAGYLHLHVNSASLSWASSQPAGPSWFQGMPSIR